MIESVSGLNSLECIPSEAAIGEFAGRDSVAAIIKALEREDINVVLPIASFAPVEFGGLEDVANNYLYLVNRVKELYGDRKTILPLIYHSSPDVWSALNGRFVGELTRKFGFYSPCIGCHAYFHIIRIPFALQLGKKIISGERTNHDGKIKLNQSENVLAVYREIAHEFGVELIQPIKDIEDGDEIEKLIGKEWREGKGHVSCVYSGNYRDTHGKVIHKDLQIDFFLRPFLLNTSIDIVRVLLSGRGANLNEVVANNITEAMKNEL